jgi:GMP synthase-like glutamine amidotransferase
MLFKENIPLRIAVLDMNNGHPNQGMRGIRHILSKFGTDNNIRLEWDEFEVRQKNEMPDTSYHAYISCGGPGSPLDEGELWEQKFFSLIEQLYNHNLKNSTEKKHVFFICHSFQLAARFFQVGNVIKRRSTSFGVFPVHKTEDGLNDPVFQGLSEPFYAVDSRDWQMVEPNLENLEKMGAKVLAIEKERPYINLERAVMAIRFSNEMIGTQFHPEADATGMSLHLKTEERKKTVIEVHGEEKYSGMLEHLNDPDKIMLTQSIIIPSFLENALQPHLSLMLKA